MRPTSKRERTRKEGLDLIPGSVRQARLEAGLSLAGVAGKDVSRSTIHLIETGRSRPSIRVLSLIAERTGKPLTYFLEPNHVERLRLGADLGKIERLAAEARHRELLEQVEALLGENPDPLTEARVRMLAGRSLVLIVEGQAALNHLRRASELYRLAGDAWAEVECADWIAGALYCQQDYGSALDKALEALQSCRQLDPVPSQIEARILTNIASIHVARNEWDQAIKTYEQAADAAGRVQDLPRLARMYDGLSSSYRELGRLVEAVRYAERSLAIYGLFDDRALLARAEGNFGGLLLRLGRYQEAEARLKRSLALHDELQMQAGKGHALVCLAELHLRQGRTEVAERVAHEAIEVAGQTGELLTAGQAHQLLGRMAWANGDRRGGAAAFRLAIAAFEQGEANDLLARVRAEFAQSLESVGEVRAALEQWKLCARAGHPAISALDTSLRQQDTIVG